MDFTTIVKRNFRKLWFVFDNSLISIVKKKVGHYMIIALKMSMIRKQIR